ncbi:MAG: hypothetical protein HY744_13055 [Deltaproteobacteria bacterium]|nr:hypothetical protein [Deltaproteobacteria bacterium]
MSRSQVTRPAVAGGRRRRPVAPDAGSEAGDAASGVALGLDRQRIEDDLMVVRRGLAGRGEKVKLGAVSLLAAVTGTGRGRAAPAGRRWPIDPAAVEIIRLALADALPAVRQRAVDLTIELEAAGGEADALRLLLGSRFSDVRRRALGRILERARQPWAQALVLDMLDDPDAALRHEALASAAGRADGRAVQHHAWALTGPHPSLKLLAIKELGSRPGKAVRELLARALLDPDPRVRRASAQALALADAYEILRGALRAPYADVRAQAALALARIGDRAAAAPLLALVTARGVPADVGPGQWRETMVVALEALAQLGDPAAHAAVCKLLDHPERSVRSAERQLWGLPSWATSPPSSPSARGSGRRGPWPCAGAGRP